MTYGEYYKDGKSCGKMGEDPFRVGVDENLCGYMEVGYPEYCLDNVMEKCTECNLCTEEERKEYLEKEGELWE